MKILQTKEQVAAEFKLKLLDLLAQYNAYGKYQNQAYIEAEDHYSGYSECGEDIKMTVTIPAIYNVEGDCVREWTEVDLGRYFGGK